MDICQSCGMPLQKEEDFGTNENGSKNNEFCHFCFQNGRFTDEGITMDEKIEKNINIAMNMGISEDKAKEMANNTIPNLKRWKK
jgi:hypothetical protein